MRSVVLGGFICGLAVGGCGEDCSTLLAPQCFAGEYKLVTAGGTSLPASFGGSSYTKIFAGHYALREDLTYERSLSSASCHVAQPDPCEPMVFVHRGTWRPFGKDSIEFWSEGRAHYVKASRNALIGCCAYGSGGDMVYVRD